MWQQNNKYLNRNNGIKTPLYLSVNHIQVYDQPEIALMHQPAFDAVQTGLYDHRGKIIRKK